MTGVSIRVNPKSALEQVHAANDFQPLLNRAERLCRTSHIETGFAEVEVVQFEAGRWTQIWIGGCAFTLRLPRDFGMRRLRKCLAAPIDETCGGMTGRVDASLQKVFVFVEVCFPNQLLHRLELRGVELDAKGVF